MLDEDKKIFKSLNNRDLLIVELHDRETAITQLMASGYGRTQVEGYYDRKNVLYERIIVTYKHSHNTIDVGSEQRSDDLIRTEAIKRIVL